MKKTRRRQIKVAAVWLIMLIFLAGLNWITANTPANYAFLVAMMALLIAIDNDIPAAPPPQPKPE